MMATKFTGFAWVLAVAATLMLTGCMRPQNQAKSVPTTAEVPRQEPADPVVSVFGLGVRAAQYDDVIKMFRTGREYDMGRRTVPAIDLVLHVATEKYDLVSLERAVVESLTDDSGNDLSLGMTQPTGRLFFPVDTNLSLDHKHGFIALNFPKAPAASTRRMTMRGTVLARSGGARQTLTFENVPFSTGSKFKVLGHDYTLNNIWSYDSRPADVNFSFAGDGSYDEVRAIRFLSPDGKKVVGRITRVDRNLRQPTAILCQVIGEKPDALRIEVDTYEKPVDLAIPFQLNLDLGALTSGEPTKLVTTSTLPAATAGEPIKSESQVMALSMVTPLTEQQSKQWFGERTSVSLYRNAGLNLQVKVHLADRKMVRLVPGTGTALSLTDDAGTSLLASASVSGIAGQRDLSEMMAISRDGHDALITVASGKMPAAGARQLRFKGKIGIVMAESEKIGEARGVSLMPGTKFKAGDVEMTVTTISAAGAAGNGMSLTLKADRELRGVVVLLDENGKQLASVTVAEDPYGRQTAVSQVMITLPKAVDTATVLVKTTSDADAVSLPVEFAVPIGLGGEK